MKNETPLVENIRKHICDLEECKDCFKKTQIFQEKKVKNELY